ncbi:serine protease 33-like [Mantella aurantiaca]
MEKFLRRALTLLTVVNIASCQVQERIVGGRPGNIGDYPWVVNLRFQSNPACGGSIISAQWVLSAAHCFPPEHDWNDYDAIAGTTNLNPTDSDTQIVLIDFVYRNPAYNEDAFSGDIALVKLKSPLTLGANVAPISLLAAGVQIPAGLSCVITGWGNTRPGVTLLNPKPLQVGTVEIISSRTCQCLHNINPSSADAITTIQPDMICAGYKDQGSNVDACQGDSGGPLSCLISGNWYQVGVVSWGEECGADNRPGVYILPNGYIDWIQGYVPDCQVGSPTIDQAPVPDNENGCLAADGNYYPYPNRGNAVLVTFLSLPLYWLSAYLLTNL